MINGFPAWENKSKRVSFVSLIEERAQEHPDRTVFSFLADKEKRETLTYSMLYERSRIIASCLQQHNLQGQRVLLIYNSGLEYISAFFGCLFASVIAVPAYPPSLTGNGGSMHRIELIIKDAGINVILTSTQILEAIGTRIASVKPGLNESAGKQKNGSTLFDLQLRWIATDTLEKSLAPEWRVPHIDEKQTAFLQYTSGSTGNPKGVMVTHENLLHNSELIKKSFSIDPDTSESVIWLPFYHDMGLIGGILQPVYTGFHCLLFPALTFLAWPVKWLQLISSVKGKRMISGGPNFAYDLCVKRVSEEQKNNLDLSNWVCAFSGSEPVRNETIETFYKAFAGCGFRREAFFPCYGMAEATLFVSAGIPGRPPKTETFSKLSLSGSFPEKASADDIQKTTLVSSGFSAFNIKIVDHENLTCSESGRIGEIWINGSSVASGYWNKERETSEIFNAYTSDTHEGPFLRTGDLGFIDDGELYVTGRLKDLIIIRGSNYYPQDLEFAAENSHNALRKGYGAAFSVDIDNEEKLIVAYEIQNDRKNNFEEIAGNIRQAISREFDLQVHSVLLLKAKSIPKTSSGKIQRKATKEGYLSRTLSLVFESSCGSLTNDPSGDFKLTSPADAVPAFEVSEHSIESVEEWLLAHVHSVLKKFPLKITHRTALQNLGFDSLMAAELKAAIDSTYGISLSFAELFREENIGRLAERIFHHIHDNKIACIDAVAALPVENIFPLLPGQKSIWFMHQVSPDSPAYNVFFAARVRSGFDYGQFSEAIQLIVNRHSQLRSRITISSGQPHQLILEQDTADIRSYNASELSESELHRIISEDAHRPFDLKSDRLFRCSVYKTAGEGAVILFSFHHIAVDLWSLMIILSEIKEIYSAFSGHRPPVFKEVSSDYRNYAVSQQAKIRSTESLVHMDYWSSRLSGELPVLNMPSDFPRPVNKNYQGSTLSFEVPADITSEIKNICIQEGITIYTFLAAAYCLLLHKYSGQDDIIIGTPAAGRTDIRYSGVVGYFVNPLPLRSTLDRKASVRVYLQQMQKTVWELLDHQDYPLALIVEDVHPQRDPGRSPLFDVMFTLERPHLLREEGIAEFVLSNTEAKTRFGSLEFESFPIVQQFAQFDLGLIMADLGDRLSASLQYSTSLFTSTTAGNFSQLYLYILSDIIRNINAPVSGVSPAVRKYNQADSDSQQSNNAFQKELLICELFEQSASRFPDKPAVITSVSQTTFFELNYKASRIAFKLQQIGIMPEKPVGVFLDQSADLIEAMIGILRSGGVYLPLNTSYPHDHLEYIISDAGIEYIITDEAQAGRLEGLNARALIISNLLSGSPENTGNVFSKPAGDNAAYIIYTSGSTGIPKGVIVSHNALANHCHYMSSYYGYSPDDKILWFASQSFDASIEQILTPLICGASVLVRDKEIWDYREFRNKMSKYDLTMINLPPAYFHQLVTDWTSDPEEFLIHKLRLVIIGGDVFPAEDFIKWQKLCRGKVRTINAYGPTETVITSLACDIPQDYFHDSPRSAVPVGTPLAGRKAIVVDKYGSILPDGIVGELYIGGDCIARGYLNNPALTAERFVPAPSEYHIPGCRFYRTGDLARYLENGFLEFHGRADKQVKIRGFRIEPGEIESVLKKHPAVRLAAVVPVSSGQNEKRLLAYIETNGQEIQPALLYSYLRDKLPEYMIPSRIIILGTMPITFGGKIDIRALQARNDFELDNDQSENVPLTDTENIVAGVIAEVLGKERIGLYDNFFELGGHSLLAAKAISKLKDLLNINIPLSAFLEHPNAAGIAAKADKLKKEKLAEIPLDDMLSELEESPDPEKSKK